MPPSTPPPTPDEELLSSYVDLVNKLSKENTVYLSTATRTALVRSREVLRRLRDQRRAPEKDKADG